MKTFGALLAVILFASSPVLGQADNPNAETGPLARGPWQITISDQKKCGKQYAADRETVAKLTSKRLPGL